MKTQGFFEKCVATSVSANIQVWSIIASALLLLCLSVAASAQVPKVVFDDATGEATVIDVSRVELRFDPSSGDYAIILTATAAKPFTGQFRINVNLFNPDAPLGSAFFADTLNDNPTSRDGLPPGFPYRYRDGDTEYILTGRSLALKNWRLGDRVAANSQVYGNPPGTGINGFSSAVGNDSISPNQSETVVAGPPSVLFPLTQGGLAADAFVRGVIFQDLFVNGVIIAAPPRFEVPPTSSQADFNQVFTFVGAGGSTETLRGVGNTNNRGGALGTAASISLNNARRGLLRTDTSQAVVHRISLNPKFDYDGVAYLFLKFSINGTNTNSSGGSAFARMVVGTHPLNMRSLNFSSPTVNVNDMLLPFGLINVFQPFNAYFALVTSATVNNLSGLAQNASADADFQTSLTLTGVQLTRDPEGTNPVPLASVTSDTGLVFRIENDVAVPFVGNLIAIDIKPDEFPNSVNSKSKGKIPVAIMSSEGFDAPQSVDVTSLTFGVTGLEQSLAFCNRKGEDVNGDGRPDLICHFQTQSVGFQPGVTHLILAGRTIAGEAIHGTDSIRMVH
ncbi:MAG TPA: hypothetical protein VMS31_16575 [Pyrinomonadaceae bacterium]|nr:hypothetical protein [Pyrinomonadaceae bacterium]